MVRFAASVIWLAISACMSAEEQLAEFGKNCEAYGFSPATDAYAECVQREAHASGHSLESRGFYSSWW